MKIEIIHDAINHRGGHFTEGQKCEVSNEYGEELIKLGIAKKQPDKEVRLANRKPKKIKK